MINLPISSDTFKRSFLGGDGQLEINSVQDAWKTLVNSNSPFDRQVDRVADLKVSLGSTQNLMLGRADTLKIGVSASSEVVHQIQLIWPDSEIDASLKHGLQPAASELLVRLVLQGKADASAKGSVPVGPLQTTFGVTAGGSIGYERLRIYPAATVAREILADLFGGLRLPQQADTVPEIPATGEVLAARLAGYLKLSGQVSYGYSMTGSREVQIGKLNLDLDYALKLSAGLSAAYNLAGEFEIEARAGASPNFARFVVRKSRDSQFNFAADFGADADLHLKGLPDTGDEFLIKAFGAHAERVLNLFDKAHTYTDINQLEQAAGKLLKGTIHDLSQSLIGKALTNATLNEFLMKALQVVDTYNNLDTRIVHLFEDWVGKIPQLTSLLDQLAAVPSRDALKDITSQNVWDLINRLVGPNLYDILLQEGAFAEFSKLIQQARTFLTDASTRSVRDLLEKMKAAFPLTDLLGQLKGITTPDQLKNLADEKLQGLAEQILGKAFEQIRTGDTGKALKELHETIDKVDQFKIKFYDKLKELTDRSYAAQLHFAYARANSRKELLDVEVDVSTAEGGRLARMAAGGDFSELLNSYKSKLVRINNAVLTHSVAASTQIQINLLGYGIEGFAQVLQNTDEALEAHDGGLLHIYTTRTQMEERRKHGGELTASTFLFATVAKALQPEGSRDYLIRTLPKMSVQYDLLKEDDKTKSDEMRQILDLASELGILPDTEKFISELSHEFPKGLGKVSAKYVTRYDSDAASAAFQLQDGPNREKLRRFAIQTMRSYIAARYIGMRPHDWGPRLGFAYLQDATFNLFTTLGFAAFANSHITVALPAWFTKGAVQKVELISNQKEALITLYNVEYNFVKSLITLDASIDALRDQTGAISPDDLHDELRAFVSMADELDEFRENAFFAVFDRLVMEGSGGRALRSSALVLEIAPPFGQKVTKVITAVTPAAEPVVLPAPDGSVPVSISTGAGTLK